MSYIKWRHVLFRHMRVFEIKTIRVLYRQETSPKRLLLCTFPERNRQSRTFTFGSQERNKWEWCRMNRHSNRHTSWEVQAAFKILMTHWILRFARRIAFHCVLHRCRSQDIHCWKWFSFVSSIMLKSVDRFKNVGSPNHTRRWIKKGSDRSQLNPGSQHEMKISFKFMW